MYDDEKNLYHYTYRKDGSETAPQPSQNYDARSAQPDPAPVLTPEPPKKKKHTAGKVVALALVSGGIYIINRPEREEAA